MFKGEPVAPTSRNKIAGTSAASKQKINIDIRTFKDIYQSLKCVFDDRKVIIWGGRAINLQVFSDYRFTHDVDVIVSGVLGDDDRRKYAKDLIDMGFRVEMHTERHMFSKVVYTPTENGSNQPIDVDLYFLTYPRNKRGMPEINKSHTGTELLRCDTLSGMPLDFIAKHTDKIIFPIGGESTEFDVGSHFTLVVAKLTAWLGRGETGLRAKDAVDGYRILFQHYGRNKVNAVNSFFDSNKNQNRHMFEQLRKELGGEMLLFDRRKELARKRSIVSVGEIKPFLYDMYDAGSEEANNMLLRY